MGNMSKLFVQLRWAGVSGIIAVGCVTGSSSEQRAVGTKQAVTSAPTADDEVIGDQIFYLNGWVAPRSANLDPVEAEQVRSNAKHELDALRLASGRPWIGESGVAVFPKAPSTGGSASSTGGSSAAMSAGGMGGSFDFVTGGAAAGGSSSAGGGTSVATNPCGWTHVGPTNVPGRVNDIAIDPTNTNLMLAATVGGLYRSTNAGERWYRVSDGFYAGHTGAVAARNGVEFVSFGDGPAAPCQILPVPGCAGGIYQYVSQNANPWVKVSPSELDQAGVLRIK
jgi:hypothetical protein